jgi:drug/metabolite transporter (DMT)-like permease
MKERGDPMKLDDLKAAWKEEIDQSVRAEGLPMTAIMDDVKKINREVRFRDFWMIFGLALGALGYLIFGWLTQENVDSLSRLGVLVFIAATTVMSVALLRARSVNRSDDWTLRSRIEMEIEKLEKQRRLMNRVGYWFLLPMLIANGISLLGGHHARTGSLVPDAQGMAIFATCGLVYGFTYWLVRRETKRKWDPVLARLQRLHTDLLG